MSYRRIIGNKVCDTGKAEQIKQITGTGWEITLYRNKKRQMFLYIHGDELSPFAKWNYKTKQVSGTEKCVPVTAGQAEKIISRIERDLQGSKNSEQGQEG